MEAFWTELLSQSEQVGGVHCFDYQLIVHQQWCIKQNQISVPVRVLVWMGSSLAPGTKGGVDTAGLSVWTDGRV